MDWQIDSESSDDNIPLKQLQRKHDPKRATEEIGSELESIYESGDSFKPTKHDYNSSDSNLSTPTDDSAKRMDRLFIERKNNSNANNQEKTGTTKENPTVSSEDIDLHRVMEITEQVATFNELATVHHEQRTLCDHIIDNAKEYVGFFAMSDLSKSFDEDISWIDFRTEIDEFSVNGSRTNRAADLLLLALANWTGQTVKLFSTSTNNTIPEHYDACVKLGTTHKPSNANQLNQSNSCHEESEITENINREISNEESPTIDNNQQSENSDVLYTCVQICTPEKPKRKRGRPKGTPPRKAPNFITPPKKKLFRKRKAMPETWKKNIRKKLRLSGKEYISVKGNTIKCKG
ncbi:unnamed protein product [Mytilus coruscus]|uniref:Uncharacterized protein n=1 Tax=Mytilus coruscus TaxID=42192 RepID=A0A6J8D918_MYTCO|nr:unnamed protein product [Mytilus coruscus]